MLSSCCISALGLRPRFFGSGLIAGAAGRSDATDAGVAARALAAVAAAPCLAPPLLAPAAAARLLSTSVFCCFATVILLPFTGADAAADAATLPLVLALLPLSRAEVEAFVSLDMRVLVGVVTAGACARRTDFDGADRAGVLTVAVDVFTAVVFTDALPLPDWGALEVTLSVALAFAIGTLTFTRTGEKDFAIQTGYCSTPRIAGSLSGEVFT
ncbi:conserved hypothetical protein [Cupriavidus taiwanensis]|uniref:Uncharacterized protein n=1 Tax=Cupriavidus taiwanensis TaxID=164546 RepID=A0A375BMG0_9BURK|nr:conserved hypothetical protein [Cupriavidus taiwanensis]